ncbi:MAG: putative metal-dependent hydrolase [Flavobacteriaceae bacterium]|jgi:hypothetical protein
MNSELLEKLKYPIGKFEWNTTYSPADLKQALLKIKNLPVQLEELVKPLPPAVLSRRYRPEGWTIAQVVHHLADSHMHSYLRFKHALLEENPTIKNYEEVKWASLPDASSLEIDYSLHLLKALHQRWVLFLENLSPEDFKRSYIHSERNKSYPLDTTLMIYAWHGEHHVQHIKNAIKQGY